MVKWRSLFYFFGYFALYSSIRQPAYLFLKVFGDILQYKFAPDLIMLDAYETVESWMIRKDLNPRKLIPAMMRYSSEPHAK